MKIIPYKPEIIHVNISSSFLARSSCVKCGEKARYYYQVRLPLKWRDHIKYKKYFAISLKYSGRMNNGDWYRDLPPGCMDTEKDFSCAIEYRGYNIAAHRARGVSSLDSTEVISCWCGRTAWLFNQKSVKNRPEITNRKGKYGYPHKFEY